MRIKCVCAVNVYQSGTSTVSETLLEMHVHVTCYFLVSFFCKTLRLQQNRCFVAYIYFNHVSAEVSEIFVSSLFCSKKDARKLNFWNKNYVWKLMCESFLQAMFWFSMFKVKYLSVYMYNVVHLYYHSELSKHWMCAFNLKV